MLNCLNPSFDSPVPVPAIVSYQTACTLSALPLTPTSASPPHQPQLPRPHAIVVRSLADIIPLMFFIPVRSAAHLHPCNTWTAGVCPSPIKSSTCLRSHLNIKLHSSSPPPVWRLQGKSASYWKPLIHQTASHGDRLPTESKHIGQISCSE